MDDNKINDSKTIFVDGTYALSYPCKTITNFLKNLYGINVYDQTKDIVFRLKKCSSPLDDRIFKLYVIFQNFYSMYMFSEWADYKDTFEQINGEKIDDMFNDFVIENNDNPFIAIYRLSNLQSNNETAMFLLWLYYQNKISIKFGHCIVLLGNLFEKCRNILDETVGEYFLMEWFSSLYSIKDIDLRKSVVEELHKLRETLVSLGVEEMYLFGSIYKNRYHKYSDIDLIIKMNDVSIKNLSEAEEIIKKSNYENFKRDTDIHLYDEYIDIYKIEDSLKIF